MKTALHFRILQVNWRHAIGQSNLVLLVVWATQESQLAMYDRTCSKTCLSKRQQQYQSNSIVMNKKSLSRGDNVLKRFYTFQNIFHTHVLNQCFKTANPGLTKRIALKMTGQIDSLIPCWIGMNCTTSCKIGHYLDYSTQTCSSWKRSEDNIHMYEACWTRRERLKSALYLRLKVFKIVKGGPFRLFQI